MKRFIEDSGIFLEPGNSIVIRNTTKLPPASDLSDGDEITSHPPASEEDCTGSPITYHQFEVVEKNPSNTIVRIFSIAVTKTDAGFVPAMADDESEISIPVPL